jgi:hypothetical protein
MLHPSEAPTPASIERTNERLCMTSGYNDGMFAASVSAAAIAARR